MADAVDDSDTSTVSLHSESVIVTTLTPIHWVIVRDAPLMNNNTRELVHDDCGTGQRDHDEQTVRLLRRVSMRSGV